MTNVKLVRQGPEKTHKFCKHCDAVFAKDSGHWRFIKDGEWRCKEKALQAERTLYEKKSTEEQLVWNRSKYNKRRLGQASVATRFTGLKASARARGIPVTLTLSQYQQLVVSNACSYCGSELPAHGHGIDRIDSSVGYSLENATACCIKCNVGKASMTTPEFLNWIEAVYNYSKNLVKTGG